MRWLVLALTLFACHPAPPPAQDPPRHTTASPPDAGSQCRCQDTCPCFGVPQPPEVMQKFAEARQICRAEHITCSCPPCTVP
jgi:hypothetical protein